MSVTGAKAAGFAFAAGAAGMFLGALAAQNQVGGYAAPATAALDEGPVASMEFLDSGSMARTVTTGIVRVHENWVLLVDQRRYVPRERVIALTLAGGTPADRRFAPDWADEESRTGERDDVFRRSSDASGAPSDGFRPSRPPRTGSPRTDSPLPPNGNPGVVPPRGNTFRED